MVAKVREQLEDDYKTLTEEVARKERRSLWRIHRMKLNRLRKAHLALEQHNLNYELRSFIQTGIIQKTEPSLDKDQDSPTLLV